MGTAKVRAALPKPIAVRHIRLHNEGESIMKKMEQTLIEPEKFYTIANGNGKVLEVKDYNPDNGAAVQLNGGTVVGIVILHFQHFAISIGNGIKLLRLDQGLLHLFHNAFPLIVQADVPHCDWFRQRRPHLCSTHACVAFVLITW